jgi:hypothetical protein
MGGIVNLAAGDPAAATAAMPPKTQTELFLWVYQCTPAPCRRVTDVRVAPAPGLDYRIWPNGRVRLKGTAVVTSTENGETIDRGTLDFVVDAAEGGWAADVRPEGHPLTPVPPSRRPENTPGAQKGGSIGGGAGFAAAGRSGRSGAGGMSGTGGSVWRRPRGLVQITAPGGSLP